MVPVSGDSDLMSGRTLSVGKDWRFKAWKAAATGAIRAFVQAGRDAQAARAKRASFCAQDFRDTGLDPSEATGITSWQADLPFFMQNGFGQN